MRQGILCPGQRCVYAGETHMALVIWRPASSRAEELAKWNVPNREERRRLILSHCRGEGGAGHCISHDLLLTSHDPPLIPHDLSHDPPLIPQVPSHDPPLIPHVHHMTHHSCHTTYHFLCPCDLVLCLSASPLHVLPLTATRLLQQILHRKTMSQ